MGRPKARVICNPTSGGGAYDPDEIRDELNGMEVDWVQTEGPGDEEQALAPLLRRLRGVPAALGLKPVDLHPTELVTDLIRVVGPAA